MKIKTFQLFWLDGTMEVVKGISIVDAFRRSGYSAYITKVLDYYKEVKEWSND